MTDQEQKSIELNTSELPHSESANKLYIAKLVAITDTTIRISLSGNGSEKKEQLKKALGEVSIVSQNRAVSKPRKL